MRLAVLSDVHGNVIALEAVLNDIAQRGGADQYLLLGDLAAIGGDPVGVLERLAELKRLISVQGNTDRYIVTGERPYPRVEDAIADPRLIPRVVQIAGSFGWTRGALSLGSWIDWLARLPEELPFRLPDGTRVLATHVAPGQNDGPGLHPGISDAELSVLLSGCGADLVLVGHTHWPLERTADGVRLVNVGSLSNPWAPDLRASYVLLEADGSGYEVSFRRVDYDRAAAIEAVRESGNPGAAFIIDWLSGHRRPPWDS